VVSLPRTGGTDRKAGQDGSSRRSPVRIDIEELGKSYGSFAALDNVSLTVRPGELLALLGPSGSGKTTLLRAIAGLTATEEGTIRFDGEDATTLSLRERRVGFVFQQYALFRHMTVFDNVAFGLRVRPRDERPRVGEISRRVRRQLDLVQLPGLEKPFPSPLSGGQRQRVALARALAIEPNVLLIDEPFGALDAKVRKELRRWLRELHTETGLTTIFVTHDQEEALELADRVVIMREGRIEQIGTPVEIYDEPASPYVCEFLGGVARFDCTAKDGEAEILGGLFPVGTGDGDYSGPALAYVRAHEIEIVAREQAEGVPAVIRTVRPFGPAITVELSIENHHDRIEVSLPRELYDGGEITVGQGVFIRATSARIFPRD
jgi:sulfate transport system ATP-binding protein